MSDKKMSFSFRKFLASFLGIVIFSTLAPVPVHAINESSDDCDQDFGWYFPSSKSVDTPTSASLLTRDLKSLIGGAVGALVGISAAFVFINRHKKLPLWKKNVIAAVCGVSCGLIGFFGVNFARSLFFSIAKADKFISSVAENSDLSSSDPDSEAFSEITPLC
jgi:hypothetical protein